ncbi:MAG: LptF/LptG family permease, partial [Bacteroidota bacterium]
YQYAETAPGGQRKGGGSNAFVRTAFKSYTKIFDLSEFDLERTNQNLFTQNRSMLATWQLSQAIDSIGLDLLERKQVLSNHLTNYLTLVRKDTIQYRPKRKVEEGEEVDDGRPPIARRSVAQKTASALEKGDKKGKKEESKVKPLTNKLAALKNPLVNDSLRTFSMSEIITMQSETGRTRIINRARSAGRSILTQAESAVRILPGIEESRVKHIYDMHMKYSLAMVCIIFVFIGAPMGAIVRKGGFGYPILVSIIFFVVFIILTIACRKLAESFVVTGTLAGWMPCILLAPVGIFLTIMAMNDRKLISLDGIRNGFDVIRHLIRPDDDNVA